MRVRLSMEKFVPNTLYSTHVESEVQDFVEEKDTITVF